LYSFFREASKGERATSRRRRKDAIHLEEKKGKFLRRTEKTRSGGEEEDIKVGLSGRGGKICVFRRKKTKKKRRRRKRKT